MSTTLFPILQPETAEEATELALCREVAWDYDTNTPVFAQGAPVIAEGAEAVKVWAWKALHTVRFRHEIYSRAYGCELENLIGQAYSAELKSAEAIRYVRDCLTINPYLKSVDEITVDFADGVLSIACILSTIYGESEVNASV